MSTLTEDLLLGTSWLHGKYPEIKAEINTHIPYVAIDDLYWQGDEADKIINEIHIIWLGGNCTIPEAIIIFSRDL